VDGLTGYGRAILRGVTRYSNLQRRWLLHKDLKWWFEAPGLNWPEFDGIILTAESPPVLKQAVSECKNVILCSGDGDPETCPVVSLDDLAAGAVAAEHLISCRLEKFAFYGLQARPVSRHRLAGFSQTLERHGLQCLVSPVSPSVQEWTTHIHRPGLIKWLRDLPKPIGIMAIDDFVSHDLADACLEARIPVPEQVAIIGVNNDDLLCEGAWPTLTSVNADYSRMGYAAAHLLEKLLAGTKLKAEERVTRLPPLGIIQRQSTSFSSVSDPNLAEALSFIRQHACDPCSVEDVLDAVPVSRRWLERQLVAQIGHSPYAEIIRVRIETARRLLTQSQFKIDDIAHRCGFSDIKNFYVAFKKLAGMTPAAFRRAGFLGTPPSR
jgi:LacI family transcriptional regulator